MAGERLRPAERLAALDWRDGEIVVDVGGGNGALLFELIQRRPELRGIVLDLPETVRDEAALGDRIEFVEGSFFESVPEGDAYVLSGILHDWPDEDAARILRTMRAAAPPHARLLINESVIRPGNEEDGAKWLDLLMLVLAGGRERDQGQWRELLASTGWEAVGFPEHGPIEARAV
jgi:precorrin-6B methylase 2